MRVLIVGAGAVGLTYGWHLQRGGADVSYFVKEKYRAAAEAGFNMYPLNAGSAPDAVHFGGFDVLSDPAAAADAPFDQIWITVSSPALRGEWLPALCAACPDATIVSFSPGVDDRDYVLQYVTADKLVTALIPFIAYQAPLVGETRFAEPGLAVWHPPFSATPMTGPEPAVREACVTLKRGGCRAKAHPAVHVASQFPTAYMMPHLVALELSGWSFAGLRKSPWLYTANRASSQAAHLMARRASVGIPFWGRLATPMMLRLLTYVAKALIPMDIETYLEYHFTKVGDQTRMFIDNYIASAAEHGMPIDAIAELKSGLAQNDAKRTSSENTPPPPDAERLRAERTPVAAAS